LQSCDPTWLEPLHELQRLSHLQRGVAAARFVDSTTVHAQAADLLLVSYLLS
jgi:hypothetical protein